MDHHYELISEDRVESEKIRSVRRIINRYREHLKKGGAELPEFELRWIRSARQEVFELDRVLRKWSGSREKRCLRDSADVGGIYQIKLLSGKRTVYLRADLAMDELGKALIHELSHVYRSSYHGPLAIQILEDLAKLDEERLTGLIEGGSDR